MLFIYQVFSFRVFIFLLNPFDTWELLFQIKYQPAVADESVSYKNSMKKNM